MRIFKYPHFLHKCSIPGGYIVCGQKGALVWNNNVSTFRCRWSNGEEPQKLCWLSGAYWASGSLGARGLYFIHGKENLKSIANKKPYAGGNKDEKKRFREDEQTAAKKRVGEYKMQVILIDCKWRTDRTEDEEHTVGYRPIHLFLRTLGLRSNGWLFYFQNIL